MKISYFVAFYDDKRAYCYHANDNTWKPYHLKLYRQTYTDMETARAVARHARHKNKKNRSTIFVDTSIQYA